MKLYNVTSVAVAAAVCGGAWLTSPPASMHGQIVVVPSSEALAPSSGVPTGMLAVTSCRVADAGLQITGRVASSDLTVVVASWEYATNVAGVRVGRAFAWDANTLPDAEPGDFQVVVPWADPSARFGVVERFTQGPVVRSVVECDRSEDGG